MIFGGSELDQKWDKRISRRHHDNVSITTRIWKDKLVKGFVLWRTTMQVAEEPFENNMKPRTRDSSRNLKKDWFL